MLVSCEARGASSRESYDPGSESCADPRPSSIDSHQGCLLSGGDGSGGIFRHRRHAGRHRSSADAIEEPATLM